MLRRQSRILLAVVAALILTCLPVAEAGSSPLAGLDEYITKAMRDWDVPGLAIAVVKDDKVVMAKGFGIRKLGESSPVDERTLFAIGSSSKAFTVASIAMLIDEGNVRWGDPVTKYLPWFQLADPTATREMTVRDLFCHRVGIER